MQNHFHYHYHAHKHHYRRPLTAVGLFICLSGLLAVAYSITLRVIPNALQYDILALLNTTPEALNNLNVIFQYSLITSLVLSGLFVDMVGPRTVLFLALAVAAICNYEFDKTNSNDVLMNSRVLIGYMHPFIMTSVLVLGTHWLPRRHFSLFVGIYFGTLLMTPEVVYPMVHGFRSLAALQKFIFMIDLVAILILFSLILTDRIADKTRHRHEFSTMFKPLTQYKVWLICIVAMVGWMSNTFLLKYGPFYLVWHYNFDPRSANDTIDSSFICFGLGGIFMGMISDIFTRQRRYFIAIGYSLAAFTFCILVFFPHVPASAVPKLIFLTAFFTSSTIICFTKANDYCAIGNSGITLGLVLSLTAIGSSLFAKITGQLLEQFVIDPSRINPAVWDDVIIVVPVLMLFGAAIAATLLKPTHLTPPPNLPHNGQ